MIAHETTPIASSETTTSRTGLRTQVRVHSQDGLPCFEGLVFDELPQLEEAPAVQPPIQASSSMPILVVSDAGQVFEDNRVRTGDDVFADVVVDPFDNFKYSWINLSLCLIKTRSASDVQKGNGRQRIPTEKERLTEIICGETKKSILQKEKSYIGATRNGNELIRNDGMKNSATPRFQSTATGKIFVCVAEKKKGPFSQSTTSTAVEQNTGKQLETTSHSGCTNKIILRGFKFFAPIATLQKSDSRFVRTRTQHMQKTRTLRVDDQRLPELGRLLELDFHRDSGTHLQTSGPIAYKPNECPVLKNPPEVNTRQFRPRLKSWVSLPQSS